VYRHILEQAGNAGAALVRDERDMVTAQAQLLGQGMGRDHMATGSTGGEYIVAGISKPGHQRPLHFTT
jgi:hypothetical protein